MKVARVRFDEGLKYAREARRDLDRLQKKVTYVGYPHSIPCSWGTLVLLGVYTSCL
jgi:hypothetical protein